MGSGFSGGSRANVGAANGDESAPSPMTSLERDRLRKVQRRDALVVAAVAILTWVLCGIFNVTEMLRRLTAPYVSSLIKVLLVDDHAIAREGYRRVLEGEPGIRVIGDASTAAEASERCLALDTNVVVMDIALPGLSAIEAMRRMLRDQPQLRILMLSMHDDAIYATRALEAGALGYLSKLSAPEVLLEAIYAVSRGERYLSADVTRNMVLAAEQSAKSDIESLTPREFEVLRLLVRGETVKSIGAKLGLSDKTVANHQSAIRETLGARNAVPLTRLARHHGFLP